MVRASFFMDDDSRGPSEDRKAKGGSLSDLLKYIVGNLVDNPDNVEVMETENERAAVLKVRVNEADMGKVIGKKGRIIKSLRILMKAAAVHGGKSISVELIDRNSVKDT